MWGSDLIGIGTFPLFKSQDAAGPNPGIQVTAMEAPAVADLHTGGGRSFFDVTAERLLADGKIGRGALQVEPRAGLAELGEFLDIKFLADGGRCLPSELLEIG